MLTVHIISVIQINNTVALNYSDLSELIYGVIKGLPKAQGQFIVKQTPEQARFCSITGEIFKIAPNKCNSIDDIAKNINIYLTNNKYPLWAIKYYIEEEMYEHEYREAMIELVSLLCEFIKLESKIDRERSKIVEDVYNLYIRNNAIGEVFGELLSAENMRMGMDYYIAQYKPELIKIAGNLGVDSKEYLQLLNTKLSKDSSYLWELGDTNRQIDNLYVDLKLIYDINRVLTTKQKTYEKARIALIDKLNIVKIPYAILEELQPNLKNIMTQFFAIKDNAQFNKSNASSVIANMAEEFVDFFNNQHTAFCRAIDRVLKTSLTEEEYKYLFDKVPSGTLFELTDKFTAAMRQELINFKKSQKTHKMHEIWERMTDSSSPSEWSMTNGIPVLCMFTDDILRAQKIFDSLNRTSNLPTEGDIDAAIDFLQSGVLNILKDSAACEKCFVEFFAGEYSYIITSPDELRDQIRAVAGSKVYDWYAKANNCKSQIRQFATERYQLKFRLQAKEKVRKLTAEQAQEYLTELIDKDPLLGISILKG